MHVRGRAHICRSRGGWKKIRAALSNYSSSRPRGGKEKRKLPVPLVSSRLILSSKEDSAGRLPWPRFGLTRTLRAPFFISFRSEICFFNSARVKRKGLERVAASSSSPELVGALISAFKRGQIVEIRSISPEGFLYDTSRAVLRVTFTVDKYYYAYAVVVRTFLGYRA